jgi:hypothetical protein
LLRTAIPEMGKEEVQEQLNQDYCDKYQPYHSAWNLPEEPVNQTGPGRDAREPQQNAAENNVSHANVRLFCRTEPIQADPGRIAVSDA